MAKQPSHRVTHTRTPVLDGGGLSVDIEAAVSYWVEVLASEGYSEHTIRQYQKVDRFYRQFLSQRLGLESPTLAALTPSNVRQFAEWLRTTTVTRRIGGKPSRRGPVTVSQYVTTLKSLTSFLVKRARLKRDPLAEVHKPKIPTREVEVFTEEQVEAMIAVAARSHLPNRNQALIAFLADTGVRVSELIGLLRDDYTPWTVKAHGRAKIFGKGAKERYVDVGKRASQLVTAYEKFERHDDGAPNLFQNQDGAPLGRTAIDDMLKLVGHNARISGVRVSAHTFRSTWATNAVQHGKAFHVQAALGHSRPETTLRYIRKAQMLAEGSSLSVLDDWDKRKRSGR